MTVVMLQVIRGVRKENDHLEHELTTAHSANDRLSLILSGISDRLRAQLEALLAAGLHTEERIEMFGRLKELLAYEEQFKQVQAQHAIETPAPQEPYAKAGRRELEETQHGQTCKPERKRFDSKKI